jgi:hypothetical protein
MSTLGSRMSGPFEPTKAAIIVQQSAEDLQQIKGMKLASDHVDASSNQKSAQSDWSVSKNDTFDAVIVLIVITLIALVVGSILMLGSFSALFWGNKNMTKESAAVTTLSFMDPPV